MVTLHLADRVGLPREAREEMMRETVQLWRAAGVDVSWSPFPKGNIAELPEIERSHPRVSVIVTPDMPEGLSGCPYVHVMASILFVGGKPTNLIAAYPSQVQRLLDAVVRMEDRAAGDRPAALRQRLMGRVLGRAIAHELGHFLFGSADHAPDGLMRAKHRLDDLTSPFTRAFRVVSARPLACAAGDIRLDARRAW